MTTTVDRTTKEQQRTTRPPGWSPDAHRGPGDWLAITIALSIIALVLIVVGVWSMGVGPVTEPVNQGDAFELEALGAFMAQPMPGDAMELERLGAWAQLGVAVSGDAFELERLSASQPAIGGDALELEALGAWTTHVNDLVTTPGDALELELLGSFTAPAVEEAASGQGDASELERLGAWTP